MSKQYSIIYADPPWSFNSKKTGGSMKSGAAAKYDTMTLEQMKALDVPAICAPDCVLVMWYVSSQPQEALDLVKAWGFTIKNMNAFIWQKLTTNLMPHFGMGYWTRAGAECALIAVRGKPKAANRAIRQVRAEMLGQHSEKPAIYRDEIVNLCGDVPRLEMFARTTAAGWDVWGNEVESNLAINGEEPATLTNEGTKPVTLEFTSEQLQAQLASGTIPFNGDHLALMLQLDGMFGKQETYNSKQVKAAVIAFDEPDMVSKAPAKQKQHWPDDITEMVDMANDFNGLKLNKNKYNEMCQLAEDSLTAGLKFNQIINLIVDTARNSEASVTA